MTQDFALFSTALCFTRRVLGASALAALLVACGGGGGGGGGGDDGPALVAPPTTAAPLTQSSAEASAAAQAANAKAALLVQKRSAFDGGSLLAPLGASSSPLSLRNLIARASRERALDRETVTCADLGFSNCSGSVTFDFNFDGNATVVPPGSVLTMTFNSLSGTLSGSAFSMNGTFRIDFLTALDSNATSLANVRFQVTMSNFRGSADGVTFGPESAVALFEFNAQGVAVITIDGLRIDGSTNLVVTDADNYTINGTSVRTAHWSNANGYVDVNYSNWRVSQGRPTLGSQVTISASTGNSIVIRVTNVTPSAITYSVQLSVGGATAVYVVTADYSTTPPTWTAVPAT